MTDNTTPLPVPKPTRLRVTFPDVRLLIIVGFFILAGDVLNMIATQPNLLANAAFMLVVGMVVGGGGLGAIVLFYFGGTKTGSDVMSAQSSSVIQQANNQPQQPKVGP